MGHDDIDAELCIRYWVEIEGETRGYENEWPRGPVQSGKSLDDQNVSKGFANCTDAASMSTYIDTRNSYVKVDDAVARGGRYQDYHAPTMFQVRGTESGWPDRRSAEIHTDHHSIDHPPRPSSRPTPDPEASPSHYREKSRSPPTARSAFQSD